MTDVQTCIDYNARISLNVASSLNLIFENDSPDGVQASIELMLENGEFQKVYAEEIGDAILRSLKKYPNSIKIEIDEIEELD